MQKMPGVGIFRIVLNLAWSCRNCSFLLPADQPTAWSFPYHEMTQAMPGGPHASWLQIGSVPMIWRGDRCKHGACVSYSDIFSITLGLYMLPTCAVNRWGREAPTESTQLLKSRTTEGTATGSGCRCFLWHCVLCIQVGRRLGRSTG